MRIFCGGRWRQIPIPSLLCPPISHQCDHSAGPNLKPEDKKAGYAAHKNQLPGWQSTTETHGDHGNRRHWPETSVQRQTRDSHPLTMLRCHPGVKGLALKSFLLRSFSSPIPFFLSMAHFISKVWSLDYVESTCAVELNSISSKSKALLPIQCGPWTSY